MSYFVSKPEAVRAHRIGDEAGDTRDWPRWLMDLYRRDRVQRASMSNRWWVVGEQDGAYAESDDWIVLGEDGTYPFVLSDERFKRRFAPAIATEAMWSGERDSLSARFELSGLMLRQTYDPAAMVDCMLTKLRAECLRTLLSRSGVKSE